MMRKLVRHGPSSLIVSLPSTWIKANGLTPKDHVHLEEIDNNILISIDHSKKKEIIEIDITSFDRTSLILLMQALYREGYSKVNLYFKKPTTIHIRTGESISFAKILYGLTPRFIGFEITKESSKSIEFSEVSFIDKGETTSIISRMHTLFLDSIIFFSETVKSGSGAILDRIEDRHNTLTKLISYLLRSISRGEYGTKGGNPAMTHVLGTLDKIIDILKYLGRERLKENIPLEKELIPLLDLFEDSFKEYLVLVRKYDPSLIASISEKRDLFKKEFKEIRGNILFSNALMLSSMQQMLELLFDLLEWRIHCHIRSSS